MFSKEKTLKSGSEGGTRIDSHGSESRFAATASDHQDECDDKDEKGKDCIENRDVRRRRIPDVVFQFLLFHQ